MDDHRFDALARRFAVIRSRRSLLKTAATGLAAGLVGGRPAAAQVSQAACGNQSCKRDPGVCNAGCVCCRYANGNSRCRPPGQCAPGQPVCPTERPFVDPVLGCVACLTAANCPAGPDACGVATCTAGVCGIAPAAAGTTCRAVAGPCDAVESCTGSTTTCPDDAALPDGEQGGCPIGEFCQAGACVVNCATATPGLQCAQGNVCSGGLCVGNGFCTDDEYLGCGSIGCALSGIFTACDSNLEGAFVCVGNVNCLTSPVCNATADCPFGFVCVSGENCQTCLPICGVPRSDSSAASALTSTAGTAPFFAEPDE